jgi:hypothetical protein
MKSWHGQTNESALAAWDAGAEIWSCSMGGLSEGYEQCIQNMGLEMLRAMVADPLDWSDYDGKSDDQKLSLWRGYTDRIESVPTVKAVVADLHPSGAQFGAAMNIASVFARNGYEKGIEMVPSDRRIRISKRVPALS